MTEKSVYRDLNMTSYDCTSIWIYLSIDNINMPSKSWNFQWRP